MTTVLTSLHPCIPSETTIVTTMLHDRCPKGHPGHTTPEMTAPAPGSEPARRTGPAVPTDADKVPTFADAAPDDTVLRLMKGKLVSNRLQPHCAGRGTGQCDISA